MKKPRLSRNKKAGTRTRMIVAGIAVLLVVFSLAGVYLYSGQSDLAAVGDFNIFNILGFKTTSGNFKTPASSNSSGQAAIIAGRYDVGVPKKVSLATASANLSAAGVKVLFSFSHLHALVINKPTNAQLAALSKNANVSWVAQEELVTPASAGDCALSDASTDKSNNGTQGNGLALPVTVAIVDTGTHGNAVVDTYMAACGSKCADTHPLQIDDADPSGYITDASTADAIMAAIDQGANVINLSGELGTIPASAFNDPNFSNGNPLQDPASGEYNTAILNALSYAADNNVVVVIAAGNNPNYENAGAAPNGTGATVVTVGALDGTDDSVASYSSPGDVYADGDAVGDADGSGVDGTSFAAPRVTADLANEMAQIGTDDPEAAVAQLMQECKPADDKNNNTKNNTKNNDAGGGGDSSGGAQAGAQDTTGPQTTRYGTGTVTCDAANCPDPGDNNGDSNGNGDNGGNGGGDTGGSDAGSSDDGSSAGDSGDSGDSGGGSDCGWDIACWINSL